MVDRIKGVIKCSLRIPEKNWDMARKMATIFHKRIFHKSDLQSPMKELEQEHNLMIAKRNLLVSSFSVENPSFLTHYVKFLVELFECEVTDIELIYQFNCQRPFADTVQFLVDNRINADNDIVGSIMKARANNSFGFCISREADFLNTVFCSEDKRSYYTRRPDIVSAMECGYWKRDSFIEITTKKTQVKYTLPYQLGWAVLQHAKRLLLSFVYQFIGRYIPPNCYEIYLTDTDSVFMGFSAKTIRDSVREDMLEEYDRECWNVLVDPRTEESRRITGKTTGLWKYEYETAEEGAVLVALSSKMYIVDDGKRWKAAAKGIQRNSLNEYLMDVRSYKDVLFSHEGDNDETRINVIQRCENRGFRKGKDGEILTYRLSKKAQAGLYMKLKVLPGRIHCMPYELKLTSAQIAHCCPI